MQKSYQLSLFIFRRDLRLHDNLGLYEALKSSNQVIPCFIFDPRQLEQNAYKSDFCLQFMAHSLKELDEELKKHHTQLNFFYGIAEEVVAQLIEKTKAEAVYFNRDYTPFSVARDEKIQQLCKQHRLDLHISADALLNEPEQLLKKDHTPYTVFTPFLHRAHELSIAEPVRYRLDNFYPQPIASCDTKTLARLLQKDDPARLVKGGRKEALRLVKKISNLKDYVELRNLPAKDGTTKLSAHNKFGTLSIRELYYAIRNEFGPKHALITELYWRDFFTHVAFHFPIVFGQAFQARFRKIKWSNNENRFRKWCEGQTGFPIVDAGMRELNCTGYMHNRVRMVTASFLVKDLHIDWRWGEKYFAQKLTDYDASVNNGNWQWAASTGCDAQPFFRIFNPWLQQERFDPECLYIKRWVPELARFKPKEIHALVKTPPSFSTNYPHPMVVHQIESARAKQLYKITA